MFTLNTGDMISRGKQPINSCTRNSFNAVIFCSYCAFDPVRYQGLMTVQKRYRPYDPKEQKIASPLSMVQKCPNS